MKSKLSLALAICLVMSALPVGAQEPTAGTVVVRTQASTSSTPRVGALTISPATIQRAAEQSNRRSPFAASPAAMVFGWSKKELIFFIVAAVGGALIFRASGDK